MAGMILFCKTICIFSALLCSSTLLLKSELANAVPVCCDLMKITGDDQKVHGKEMNFWIYVLDTCAL